MCRLSAQPAHHLHPPLLQVAGSSQCVALLPSLPIFLELAAHPEAPVALAAAQCLAASAEAFPEESAGALLAPQLQVTGGAPVVAAKCMVCSCIEVS